MDTSAPVRVALLGCGQHARMHHAASLARLAGASPSEADTWALVAGIVLLGTAGAGSALRTGRSGTTAAVTGLLGALFGVAAILLKTMIHSVH